MKRSIVEGLPAVGMGLAGMGLAGTLFATPAQAAETYVCPAADTVVVQPGTPPPPYQSNLPGWKAAVKAQHGIVPLGFNGAQFDIVPGATPQFACYYATDTRGGTIAMTRTLGNTCHADGAFKATAISWAWQCFDKSPAACKVACD